MRHLQATCLVYKKLGSSKQSQLLSYSHTHSYTDGGGCRAVCQLLIRSNLGSSVLLKEASTCSQRFKSTCYRLLDDPLYFLSYCDLICQFFSHVINCLYNVRVQNVDQCFCDKVGETTPFVPLHFISI